MDRLGSTKEETGFFKHSSSGLKKCREIDQNAVHVLVERLSKETRNRKMKMTLEMNFFIHPVCIGRLQYAQFVAQRG